MARKYFLEKNLVYILLNKPKDYITTTDDPQKRKTVLELLGRATEKVCILWDDWTEIHPVFYC